MTVNPEFLKDHANSFAKSIISNKKPKNPHQISKQ